jgi:serine/threonine protein phosphatase 1
MSLTYVIPDLHGRDDLLREAFAAIDRHAGGGFGTIVALGDYVDKGPDSKRVIALLRAGPRPGWRFIALKGNHDGMMVQGLRDPAWLSFWLERGGDSVIKAYGGDSSKISADDIDWLDRLALMHVDDHRIYVHAGLDPELPLDRQTEQTLLWKRYPDDETGGFGDRHIVHGHDSSAAGPKLFEGRSNLDTKAWRTGRLVIAVFDDGVSGGPIEILTVQEAPDAAS